MTSTTSSPAKSPKKPRKRSTKKSPTKTKSGEPRAKWTDKMVEFLVDQLIQQEDFGKRADQSWKAESWSMIKDKIFEEFQVLYNNEQLKQKWQDIKGDYITVRDLRDKSGYGWDEENQLVTNSVSVWKELEESEKKKQMLELERQKKLKAEGKTVKKRKLPNLRKWRHIAFPLYDRMHQLCDGKVPTGDGKYNPLFPNGNSLFKKKMLKAKILKT
jgi:Myb/SANT-like DNA-binding domain